MQKQLHKLSAISNQISLSQSPEDWPTRHPPLRATNSTKSKNIYDMNMKREIHGLKSALDFFGLKEGVILTYNQTDLFEIEGVSIKLTPVWKYMITF
jgi:hypothetical protein